MATIRCPVCKLQINLEKTKKEGVLYGACKGCRFRGFFPEEEVSHMEEVKRVEQRELRELWKGIEKLYDRLSLRMHRVEELLSTIVLPLLNNISERVGGKKD